MLEVLAALGPSLLVALLFWWVIRAMLRGDRREGEVMARLDREAAAARAAAGPTSLGRPAADDHPEDDRVARPRGGDAVRAPGINAVPDE